MGYLGKIWHFYRDGFRNMTWGRTLWLLIILKVIILFAILRVFFFKPAMAGLDDSQKGEYVGEHLIQSHIKQTDTLNLKN